jgi:hypothetical protein
MKGQSPAPTSQTTKAELSPEQRELLNLAMPHLRQFSANPPKLPGFSQVPEFTPEQMRGQEMALGAAGGQEELARSGADATKFLMNKVLFPESNPALQGYINAATRPIGEQLTQVALPAIRGSSRETGTFGGSRQGIAEGLASQGASRAIGDTTSRIASTGYGQGLEAQGKALALLPQTQGAQLAPALTTSGVGDVRQQLLREILGEKANRFTYEETLPLLMGRDLAGLVAGLPGGGTTTMASGPPAPPAWMRGLGGAASGASMGSMLGPWGTVAGGGIGALLGFMG